jgi:hypothetical protein
MRRWILASLMLAFPIVGGLAFAGTAAAAGGASCSTLGGSVSSTGAVKGKLSGCTDTKNTGGKGTFKNKEGATTGSITWNGTGTTTADNITDTPVSPGTCPSGDEELEVTGTITGGTGAAAKSIKKGWTFQAFVCANLTTGAISLAPSTLWEMGPKF